MIKSKFKDFLYFLKNKRILITSHNIVDLDGLSSAIALNSFLKHHFENIKSYLYFSGISNNTSSFIKTLEEKFPNFKLDLSESFDNLEIDAVIIVDANNPQQITLPCNLTNKKNIQYYYIDHHFIEESSLEYEQSKRQIILDNYSSTAEIIYIILKEFEFVISIPIRYLLIAGILTDSGYFKFANNNTIKVIGELLEDDIEYQDLLIMLKFEMDISEKIAKIKGIQRTELIREGDWLIGISNVSSFEASVANLMTKIGLDIAIVFSEKDMEYRVSTRAKKKLCMLTGLHLGKILEQIAKDCEANGGGHDGAAGINIKKEYGDLREIIINRIIHYLRANKLES